MSSVALPLDKYNQGSRNTILVNLYKKKLCIFLNEKLYNKNSKNRKFYLFKTQWIAFTILTKEKKYTNKHLSEKILFTIHICMVNAVRVTCCTRTKTRTTIECLYMTDMTDGQQVTIDFNEFH